MKHTLLIVAGLLISGVVMADTFRLTSPQISEGTRIAEEHIYNEDGCHGGNVSPALQWSNAPEGTRSFAVTVYDIDVPGGGGWWHWVIFNIPGSATGLAKGAGDPHSNLAPPGAIQIRNDFGTPGYGGPCPPPGNRPHRYEFTVYALKIEKLPLDKNSSAVSVGYYLHENVLGKAVIRATYGR